LCDKGIKIFKKFDFCSYTLCKLFEANKSNPVTADFADLHGFLELTGIAVLGSVFITGSMYG